MENSSLPYRGIIETISLFSLFEYPLTASELALWLKSDHAVNAGYVYRAAVQLTQKKESPIGFKNGFFFLSCHEASVEHRMQNFLTHLPKFSRARRAVRLISWIPFLRMAAICNTVAMATSNQESDIDFFIVARAGRLWLVRLLTALVLQCAGMRRHGRHIANRICLSFYVADSALGLSGIRLPNGDIYMLYWPTQLVLLFNKDGTYEKFAHANAWVREDLPNTDFENALSDTRVARDGYITRLARRTGERALQGAIGDIVERVCRFIQRAKMCYTPHGARPATNAVVISDTMLKFHERDRRQEFHEAWQRRVKSAFGDGHYG
ncbi:MAG: hypothetical protein HY981_00895 [Candidatus Magasanikbacteria bacterium]|nr:hypothetical protein [Candidatus Magasanikbacteria bacterium]